MKANTCPLAVYTVAQLPRGEFVRRATKCKACNGTGAQPSGECVRCNGLKFEGGNTVFIRGEYDRESKTYSLASTEDACREVFVKKTAKLIAGFSY